MGKMQDISSYRKQTEQLQPSGLLPAEVAAPLPYPFRHHCFRLIPLF